MAEAIRMKNTDFTKAASIFRGLVTVLPFYIKRDETFGPTEFLAYSLQTLTASRPPDNETISKLTSFWCPLDTKHLIEGVYANKQANFIKLCADEVFQVPRFCKIVIE